MLFWTVVKNEVEYRSRERMNSFLCRQPFAPIPQYRAARGKGVVVVLRALLRTEPNRIPTGASRAYEVNVEVLKDRLLKG